MRDYAALTLLIPLGVSIALLFVAVVLFLIVAYMSERLLRAFSLVSRYVR